MRKSSLCKGGQHFKTHHFNAMSFLSIQIRRDYIAVGQICLRQSGNVNLFKFEPR